MIEAGIIKRNQVTQELENKVALLPASSSSKSAKKPGSSLGSSIKHEASHHADGKVKQPTASTVATDQSTTSSVHDHSLPRGRPKHVVRSE